MIVSEKKRNLVASSFVSDALKLLETLNTINDKNMTDTENQAFLENINEFSKSFIYFREAYDQKSSNIQHLAILLEEIRAIVDNGNATYTNSNDQGICMDILLEIINESSMKMGQMDDYLLGAEKEEHENKRMQVVEKIFIDTKLGVEGAKTVFKEVGQSVKASMNSIHEELEKMDGQLNVIENTAKEFKTQCDKVVKMGDDFELGFKNWKTSSHEEIDKAFNDIIENIKAQKQETTDQKNKAIEEVSEAWKAAMAEIESKSGATLVNVQELNNESSSLLKKEGVKQFLVYGGTVMAGLNFFLLLALLLFK